MWKKLLLIGALAVLVIGTVAMSYSNGNKVSGKDIFYMVSHSEYWTGEEGQVVARLYNWQGDPILVDDCKVNIYYPDKTLFVTDGLTDDSLEATTGTHYYNFTTPTVEGIYQYMVTCNYSSKQRSVANSFHLSPALNFIDTINENVNNLTAQEQVHFDITQVNLSTIGDGVIGIQTDIDVIEVNISDIYSDTQYIRSNLLTNEGFNDNMTIIFSNLTTISNTQNNILNNLSALAGYCDDVVTSGSQLCLWVDEINNKVTNINTTIGTYTTILTEINETTHSTYDYMTGTLATNINNIFGVVNDIEANTLQINATVTDIKANVTTVIDNQEEVVYMEVTS